MSEFAKKIGTDVGNMVGSTVTNVTSQGGSFVQLMKDLDNFPGINESDGFISQDSSIIVINVSYNSELTSMEEIHGFIISEGFDIYSKQ